MSVRSVEPAAQSARIGAAQSEDQSAMVGSVPETGGAGGAGGPVGVEKKPQSAAAAIMAGKGRPSAKIPRKASPAMAQPVVREVFGVRSRNPFGTEMPW